VIYHNGDVSVCEHHTPLGNIRQQSFKEIWYSEAACQLRDSICAKECYCTNEIFLWPSITFQPRQLVRAMAGAKVWRKTIPLPVEDRADWRHSGTHISLPVHSSTHE
jgi:hypothetical protein